MRRCVRRPLRDDSERMIVFDVSEEAGQTLESVEGPATNGMPRGWLCVRTTCLAAKTTGRPTLDSSEDEEIERSVQPESTVGGAPARSARTPIDPNDAKATARHAMASTTRLVCFRATNTLTL
jgi:hypothetical protein